MPERIAYRVSSLIAQRRGSDTIDGLHYQNAGTANAAGYVRATWRF